MIYSSSGGVNSEFWGSKSGHPLIGAFSGMNATKKIL